MKVRELPVHVQEFLLQLSAHRSTRLQPTSAQLQKLPDLFERKSQSLHLPDKPQRFHVAVSVLAKPTRGSWRTRQQGISLIEPNRVGSETDLLCNPANVHCLTPPFNIYTLDYSPESSSSFRPPIAASGNDLDHIQLRNRTQLTGKTILVDAVFGDNLV
jgi:hypothetical protein